MEKNLLLQEAIHIAVEAHYQQFDMGGEPQVLHAVRVSQRMNTPNEQIVAILHDVLEDSPLTEETLYMVGFPLEIIESVSALTRKDGEDYLAEYIPRVLGNKIATRVKLADLEDNMDIRRLPLFDGVDGWSERLIKYQKAREMILNYLKNTHG